ncbi:MAG: hypothetical protein JWM86_449 [Thermoleophilia bacterium]|nr:hypothetical protein [Thermoleophilia bacterium]
MMRLIRKNFTYANVISLLVIVVATTGTAFGATKMYSGLQIKNESLTGADVKNASLGRQDLSKTSHLRMRGRTGPQGTQGIAGIRGPKGETGPRGPMGKQANSLVRYASFTSPFLNSSPAGSVANPGTAKHWDAADYPANFTAGVPLDLRPRNISNQDLPIIELTGAGLVTTGTLEPRGAGRLTATATLTLMHFNHSETQQQGDGIPLHGRVKCTLHYANNNVPLTASSPKLGTSETLSTRRTHRLVTITLVGSDPFPASTTANYNVGVTCADMEYTTSTQWKLINANLTAHAVWVGP